MCVLHSTFLWLDWYRAIIAQVEQSDENDARWHWCSVELSSSNSGVLAVTFIQSLALLIIYEIHSLLTQTLAALYHPYTHSYNPYNIHTCCCYHSITNYNIYTTIYLDFKAQSHLLFIFHWQSSSTFSVITFFAHYIWRLQAIDAITNNRKSFMQKWTDEQMPEAMQRCSLTQDAQDWDFGM